MAVDGRKLNQSLYQGSDIEHDFPCSPCSKEGKNVAAIKHCVECDENLCKKCLGDHNKFSVMRGHQLLDTVKQLSGKKQEIPSQRCERHGGKLIDVYCPGHDKVGCSTCMTIEHSGCKGMNYVPDLACKTKTSEKLNLLEAELNTLQSRFKSLKQNKQEELENAKKEKSQLIKEIKSERKKINDHLDKMEMELLQEVDVSFQIKLQHIESCMKEVDANIASLQENMQKISAAKNENESEKYVQIKRVNERRKDANDCFEDLRGSRKTGSILRLEPNKYVTDSECNLIGNVLHLPLIEAEKCSVINMRTKVDKESCLIFDMCMSEDGCIFVADYNNKYVKKMNDCFQIISSLKVTDNPYSICQIDSSMLAVTLINDKTVQFISQKEPIKLQQSFEVGDRCRGIAYNDGMIYVCCGGSKERTDEEVGHLEVYTISGQLLASYFDVIQCPSHVIISSLKMEIFVSDIYEGIFLFDKNRRLKPIPVDKKLFSGHGRICEMYKGQICAGFFTSNNVLLMSTDGKDQVELLTGQDGLTKPIGLCFDNKTSRLFVSCYESDTLTVFTLKQRH
ncbi:uncharacterized protein LOC132722774 isoform X1 [Ruditapes philippinarum]|uniref:uncharacterized protein LOC132722774 isoform X1 n=1 Tax=Ruditapes philippinarum TaxID=129788 RepID=UPI00295B8BC0|nr:uncharacterized protein LOC132722774 isoform X1 [Ruditapes philippinarum]